MKHLARMVEGIFIQLSSDRKGCVFTSDWKGKSVLKQQSCRDTGGNRQKHSTDHPRTLNFLNATSKRAE